VKHGALGFMALGVGLLLSHISFADEPWPITFQEAFVLAKTPPPGEVDQPGTSQPALFDPAQYKTVKDIPKSANFQSVTSLWPDAKPFSLKEYYFDTDDDPSYVLEISEGEKRQALYTQVTQYQFSPDHKTLLLENLVKQPSGKWLPMSRIIDVASKRAAAVPPLDCARFYAEATNTRVITYGPGTKNADETFGPPRTVCVWDFDGKLQYGLTVPMQNTLANTEASPNKVGLLPGDETTLYQLAYADKHCILRLQSLINPKVHRQILLPSGAVNKEDEKVMAAGENGDPCENGVAVDIDLEHLTFKGGNLRFRVSKSGRGDLAKDWTDWQAFS
jgi:hypothetical protein